MPFLRRLRLRRPPAEALVWAGALVALALTDPAGEGLLRLCLFDHLGLPCPGCGLGHSIAYLLEGAWQPALQAHPLGPLALAVLAGRIVHLLRPAPPSPLVSTVVPATDRV